MHKKHHEKFKILDILAVTTQAREGIDTSFRCTSDLDGFRVTTQAREGIDTNNFSVVFFIDYSVEMRYKPENKVLVFVTRKMIKEWCERQVPRKVLGDSHLKKLDNWLKKIGRYANIHL